MLLYAFLAPHTASPLTAQLAAASPTPHVPHASVHTHTVSCASPSLVLLITNTYGTHALPHTRTQVWRSRCFWPSCPSSCASWPSSPAPPPCRRWTLASPAASSSSRWESTRGKGRHGARECVCMGHTVPRSKSTSAGGTGEPGSGAGVQGAPCLTSDPFNVTTGQAVHPCMHS